MHPLMKKETAWKPPNEFDSFHAEELNEFEIQFMKDSSYLSKSASCLK